MGPEDNSLEQHYVIPDYATTLVSPPPDAAPIKVKRLPSLFQFNRRAFAVTGGAVLFIMLAVGVGFGINQIQNASAGQVPSDKGNYNVSTLSVDGVKGDDLKVVSGSDTLAVNGQLQIKNTLVLTPSGAPVNPTAGQVYYDKTTNTPFYYNGTAFVPISTSISGVSGPISLGGGLSLVNSTIVNSGVISIQGQTGAVNFASGPGIAINGSTISNSGLLGIGGNSNQLAITSSGGNAQISILGIQAGGVLVGTTGNGISTVLPGGAGECLVSNGSNQPVFASCTGAGGVSSIDAGNGALVNAITVQGSGGISVGSTGNNITIDGAALALPSNYVATLGTLTGLSVSGNSGQGSTPNLSVLYGATSTTALRGDTTLICPSGTGNLSGGGGTITLANNTSCPNLTVVNSPSFSGSVTASGGVVVGTGKTLTATGSGIDLNAGGGVSDTVTFWTSNGANSFILPTTGGLGQTICTTAITCAAGGGQAVILEPGASPQSSAAATAAIFINKTIAATGNLLQLQSNGTDKFVINNKGEINSLLLNGGVAGTDYVTLQSAARSGALTINVPNVAGGPYDLCLSSGNCAGTGGGITGSGSINTIAMFTGSGTLGNSLLSQSGTTTTVGGYLSVPSSLAGPGTIILGNGGTNGSQIQFKNATNSNTLTLQSGVTAGNFTLTLPTGDGTANQCLSTNGSGQLTFQDCLTGGGSGGGVTQFNTKSGAITLAGTANQIIITESPSGTFTLSTPQNIATTSTPTFAGLTISGTVAYQKGADYSTTGASNDVAFGAGSLIRLTGASAQTITGIASGTDGRILTIVNAGSNAATISNNSGSSSAANRIITGTGGDLSLPAGASITLIYDSGASVWRTSGAVAGSGGTGVTTIGALDGQSRTGNGATIVGSSIYLQTANASFAGLISTGAQSLAGDKTFTGQTVFNNLGTALKVQGVNDSTTAVQILQNGGGNVLTVDTNNTRVGIGSGAGTPSATLDVSGTFSSSGGAINLNTTGSSNTSIGNGTGTFSLSSSGLDVSTSGALTGVSGITSSGSYTQSGSSVNLFTGASTFKNNTNSTSAFQIQNAAGSSNLFIADTTNTRIGIGRAPTTYTLEVGGDIYSTSGLIAETGSNISKLLANNLQFNSTGTSHIDQLGAGGSLDFTTRNTAGSSSLTRLTFGAGDNASVAFTNGLYSFKPGSDSATAFQIQNASSTTLFNVDTSIVTNLVTNGHFETDTSGWLPKGSAALTRTTSHQEQGVAAMQVATTVAANDGAKYNYSLAAGTTYTLTLYAKLASGSMSTLAIGRSNDTGSADTNCLSGLSLYNNYGWQKFTCTFTMGGTVSGTRYVYLKQTDAASRNILVDGVQLETGTISSAFNPGGALQVLGYLNSPLTIQPKQGTNGALLVKASDGTNVFNVDSNCRLVSIGDRDDACTNSALLSVQDATTDNVGLLSLNQKGTGNIAQFSESGTTVLTVGQNGAISSKNSVDSTNAFQVQNASSASLFNIDSLNNNISINGANVPTVQTWQTGNNSGFLARESFTAVVANGYVYIIGGINSGSTATNTVQYAKILANGNLGNWSTVANLPAARDHASAVFANGYIYVTGGATNETAATGHNDVYYGKVGSDGNIASWTTSANPIFVGSAQERWRHSSFVANGYLYVAGGQDTGATIRNTVYKSKLNSDGSNGIWTSAGTTLSSGVYSHSTAVANGYVYAIGGAASINVPSTLTQYAKLNVDGSIGAWNTTQALPDTRNDTGIAIINGTIYITGGESGGYHANTFYATLGSAGTIGPWSCQGSAGDCNMTPTNTTALPATRSEFGSVPLTANGYIYVIGGWNAGTNNTVYYTSTSRVAINGSLDLVGTSGQNLNEGNSGGALTAGNTNIVGTLNVQDTANFVQSVAIGANLNVGGDVHVTGTLTVTGAATFSSNITVNGHILGGGTTPSVAAQSGAGTTGSCSLDTANGATNSDIAGSVSIVPGGTGIAAIDKYCRVTFSTTYGVPPRVSLTPANDPATQPGTYITTSTTGAYFDINFHTAGSSGTTYVFNYHVIK